jgi:hypothetical protein
MREQSIFGSRIHLVCIALSLLICGTSSYGETVEIKTALKFPILSNGKIAGYSTAATGSKVEVLTRDGDKLQVRYRAFEPIWIQNSDIIEKTKDSGSESDQQDDSTSFDPQKAIGAMASENTDTLVGILKGKKYPDKSLQTSFDQSIKNFVKSKLDLAIASQKKPQIDKEVERLRRNADVTGRPNLLNPSDRSGQERAQRIRSEADSLETKASQEIAKCEERLESAQVILSDYLNNWFEAEKRIQEQERLAEEKKHQAEAEAKLNQEIEASKLASIQKEQERLAEEKKHQAEAPIATAPIPSASPQSEKTPQALETSTPKDISNKEDVSSNTNADLDNANVSIGRRGPEVHGFQLGMSLDDFKRLVQEKYPSEIRFGYSNLKIRIGDLIGKHGAVASPKGFVANTSRDPKSIFELSGHKLFNKRNYSDFKEAYLGDASVTYIATGNPKSIIYFSLERPILEKLFKIENVGFDNFCQKFIDNYSIPGVKGKKGKYQEHMKYESPDGWAIYFEGFHDCIVSVTLLANPRSSEDGFGM